MTNQVLVTGGTGRLGRALVPRLLDAGEDKAIRDLRAGHHRTPNQAFGRITFEDFLAGHRTRGCSQ